MGMCHVCNSESVITVSSQKLKKRVSGDCKIVNISPDLLICNKCSCVQKNITPKWQETVDNIYKSYTVYYQADGSEQLIFINGIPRPRSHRIISELDEHYDVPVNGRLLDIGCGNGSFLRTFHQYRPEWRVSGSELYEHNRSKIESIPGFDNFWCCSPKEISETFNIVSIIHVLSHIISPVSFLTEVRERLSEESILLIVVPNYLQNPFDLIIADSTTHFSLETLRSIVKMAGFEIIWESEHEIPRELILIAKKAQSHRGDGETVSLDGKKEVTKRIKWLENIRSSAISSMSDAPCGIFGAAIAATWLFAENPDQVLFFVDEDPSTVGKTLFGRPILYPTHIPQNSRVFLPFCYNQAHRIKQRLEKQGRGIEYILPPVLENQGVTE